MQQYIKNYYKAFRLTCADEVMCEKCGRLGQEIHHIQHRSKSQPELDEVDNLICLCITCHKWIHSNNTQENKELLRSMKNEY